MEEGTLSISFYETNITLISKLVETVQKQENYRLMSLMNLDAKNSQQNIGKLSKAMYKNNYILKIGRIYPRYVNGFNI